MTSFGGVHIFLTLFLARDSVSDDFLSFNMYVIKSRCLSPSVAVDQRDLVLFTAVIKRENNLVPRGSYFVVEYFETHNGEEFKYTIGTVSMYCNGYYPPADDSDREEGTCSSQGKVIYFYISHLAAKVFAATRIVGSWVTLDDHLKEVKQRWTLNATLSYLDSSIVTLRINDVPVPPNDYYVEYPIHEELTVSFCTEHLMGQRLTMHLGGQEIVQPINNDCIESSFDSVTTLAGGQLFVCASETSRGCVRRIIRKVILIPSLRLTFRSSSMVYRTSLWHDAMLLFASLLCLLLFCGRSAELV
ncbi:hypothetical protein Btru_050831 [Bulinus truncatus]|nr:hypothetical protein Btru_050831 [Bulinus truncatus]